jgi:hypothetical protein
LSGFASGIAAGPGEVDDCEHTGYSAGLSAGLAMVLADLDDADLTAVAHGGFAAVPARRVPDGATVVEHRLAAEEGVAILDLRLPAGLVRLRHTGNRARTVGLRLAAVRIGLLRKVLDHALTHAVRPMSLVRYRLTLRAITDVVTAVEASRRQLAGMGSHPSRAAVAEVHARLTWLDWRVARLFWPDGYRHDHPVRVLFVAELVASIWVGN